VCAVTEATRLDMRDAVAAYDRLAGLADR
jgi:hypothetical protein